MILLSFSMKISWWRYRCPPIHRRWRFENSQYFMMILLSVSKKKERRRYRSPPDLWALKVWKNFQTFSAHESGRNGIVFLLFSLKHLVKSSWNIGYIQGFSAHESGCNGVVIMKFSLKSLVKSSWNIEYFRRLSAHEWGGGTVSSSLIFHWKT